MHTVVSASAKWDCFYFYFILLLFLSFSFYLSYLLLLSHFFVETAENGLECCLKGPVNKKGEKKMNK